MAVNALSLNRREASTMPAISGLQKMPWGNYFVGSADFLLPCWQQLILWLLKGKKMKRGDKDNTAGKKVADFKI